MALITFEDKVSLNPQPSVADKNKVKDSDMNMIKNAVNNATTYSTSETRIGTWIDGKPIYRRVVPFDASKVPTNNTIEIADLSSWNIDLAITIRGFLGYYANQGDISTSFRPISLGGGGSDDIRMDIDNKKLRIRTFSNWVGWNRNCAIIEYTKTTD
jgi:hypothetical protein